MSKTSKDWLKYIFFTQTVHIIYNLYVQTTIKQRNTCHDLYLLITKVNFRFSAPSTFGYIQL